LFKNSMGGLFSKTDREPSDEAEPKRSEISDENDGDLQKEISGNASAALNDTVSMESPKKSANKRNISVSEDNDDLSFPMTKRIKPHRTMPRSVTSPPSFSSPTTSWWCKLLIHKDGHVIEVQNAHSTNIYRNVFCADADLEG
jgi:hypothetical protein